MHTLQLHKPSRNTDKKKHHDSPCKRRIRRIFKRTHKKEQSLTIRPKAQDIGDQPKTRQTPSAIEAADGPMEGNNLPTIWTPVPDDGVPSGRKKEKSDAEGGGWIYGSRRLGTAYCRLAEGAIRAMSSSSSLRWRLRSR